MYTKFSNDCQLSIHTVLIIQPSLLTHIFDSYRPLLVYELEAQSLVPVLVEIAIANGGEALEAATRAANSYEVEFRRRNFNGDSQSCTADIFCPRFFSRDRVHLVCEVFESDHLRPLDARNTPAFRA